MAMVTVVIQFTLPCSWIALPSSSDICLRVLFRFRVARILLMFTLTRTRLSLCNTSVMLEKGGITEVHRRAVLNRKCELQRPPIRAAHLCTQPAKAYE